jgi:hypothetical protein
MKSQSLTLKFCQRAHFIGSSEQRIIMSWDEAALARPSHEQNIQMKSQKRLGVTSGDPRHTRARAAKSSVARAFFRPVQGKYSRARHTQRQTAAKSAILMSRIGRFMKAYADLRRKLYARSSEHTFDHGDRAFVSRAAAHLDVRDRVSMKTDRARETPNRPIQRSKPFEFMRSSDVRNCADVRGKKVTALLAISPNQWGIQ